MRITKVVIVGCTAALSKERRLLDDLVEAYDLKTVITLREDPFGKAVRKRARRLGLGLKTISARDFEYEDATAVAIGSMMWLGCKRYIAFWDGRPGHSRTFIEICLRMKKKLKVFEV